MSNTPVVKLPVSCDRTNKTVEIKLPLDQVEGYLSALRAREQASTILSDQLESASQSGPMPDMVVYYKGAFVVLTTVLDKHDAVVLRLLHEATQSETFPKPPARKKRNAAKTPKKQETTGKSNSAPSPAPAE